MTIAPCGHPGEHVIGNYIRCTAGCEGPAVTQEDRVTEEICLHRSGYIYKGVWRCSFCDQIMQKKLSWW